MSRMHQRGAVEKSKATKRMIARGDSALIVSGAIPGWKAWKKGKRDELLAKLRGVVDRDGNVGGHRLTATP